MYSHPFLAVLEVVVVRSVFSNFPPKAKTVLSSTSRVQMVFNGSHVEGKIVYCPPGVWVGRVISWVKTHG